LKVAKSLGIGGWHGAAEGASKDSDQTETAPRKFKLGPLGSLNQVTKGLAKTIRAMADGTLDSQVGARVP